MAKIVILSTADMNSAVWTNKQHLAVRLSETHEVSYVESIGLRRVRFSLSDMSRIISRLTKPKARTDRSSEQNTVDVIRPHVLPFHRIALIKRINSVIFGRQIRKHLLGSTQQTVLWTFSPVTYGVERCFDFVVYHSVDLLHEIEGLPYDLILDAERHIVSESDAIIASSSVVRQHLLSQSAYKVLLWENVADTHLFASTKTSREPQVVFAGNLTPGKIDFSILTSIAETGKKLIIAGPSAIDGTKENHSIAQLRRYHNVEFLGNLGLHDLAVLLNSSSVGIIPYLQNRYTAGVFPMKVYEYLASGLSIVATELPSLAAVVDSSIHLSSREEFTGTVLRHLQIDQLEVEKRKSRSLDHSWISRTVQANDLIHELSGTP